MINQVKIDALVSIPEWAQPPNMVWICLFKWKGCVRWWSADVTFTLQVWFREGIHPRVPEGTSWEEVEVPKEVAQISAGPGDLLWALLWDGNLLVRTGLSLDSPTGELSL